MKSKLVALLVFLASVCAAQPPQAPGYWAWMGGRALVSNVAPVYGTKFQFAPGNWPGQRDGAVTWTDKNGRFWLFGGSRGSLVSCANYLNDLWAFDPKLGAHGQWAWMGGTKPVTCVNNTSLVSAGAYGTEYQFADGNLPYGRSNATTAVDSAGRLWLFSGFAADSGLSLWSLGDLWVFDPAKGAHGQWAWMGGDRAASCGQAGCPVVNWYGARYGFDASNWPAQRWGGHMWFDKNGKLWLFSGQAAELWFSIFTYNLYDLWVFDPAQGAHGEWAWMGGDMDDSRHFTPGIYGTEYEFASDNWPSARYGALGWTDDAGLFWLFGGFGPDATSHLAYMNDLWAFDPTQGAHGEWKWMGGEQVVQPTVGIEPSFFGVKYEPGPYSMIGGRYSPTGWKDNKGRFWVYGGSGYDTFYPQYDVDELWMFDPHLGTHGQWAWMGGHKTPYNEKWAWQSNLGTEFTFASSQSPGGRESGLSWTDADGNLWLYGGTAIWDVGYQSSLYLDDLWEYRFRTPQAVNFPKPAASFTYGDSPITLSATASSGLPVAFTLNAGPARLSGATLALTGGGASVVVTASQAGNADYLAAQNVKQSIWVNKHALTVKADNQTMPYGTTVPPLTWTPSGFVNGDTAATALTGTAAVTTAATSKWAPGNYRINIAPGTLTSSKYLFTFVPGTLTITPLGTMATPSLSLPSGTYSGTQMVHITGAGCPCMFFYTTDGSTPSATHGTKYSTGITVSSSQTVKAVSTNAGYTPSAVISATYTIQ